LSDGVVDLVVMRHGIAVDRDDPACPDDPARPLTDDGIVRTIAAARGLRALGIAPRTIWTSPFTRSIQTAEIVARAFPNTITTTTEALAPGGDVDVILRLLADGGPHLVVGHNPDLLHLIAVLVSSAPVVGLVLKKAGAVGIVGPLAQGRAQMRWFASPAMLRRLGHDS
jgi:phosphohistidine phosphatase